jgi:hypothetical protein
MLEGKSEASRTLRHALAEAPDFGSRYLIYNTRKLS